MARKKVRRKCCLTDISINVKQKHLCEKFLSILCFLDFYFIIAEIFYVTSRVLIHKLYFLCDLFPLDCIYHQQTESWLIKPGALGGPASIHVSWNEITNSFFSGHNERQASSWQLQRVVHIFPSMTCWVGRSWEMPLKHESSPNWYLICSSQETIPRAMTLEQVLPGDSCSHQLLLILAATLYGSYQLLETAASGSPVPHIIQRNSPVTE